MIYLIASDVDGTLLQNNERIIRQEVIEAIKQLKEKGIMFAAASGRQYENLKKLFFEVQDDIAYICENGALIKYKEKTVSKTPLDRYLGIDLLNDIDARENCEFVLSGEKTCYLRPHTSSFVEHVKNQIGNNVTLIKDFDEVKEPFLKISIYNKNGINYDSDYYLNRWGEKLKTTVSGKCWMDFTNLFVNKGNALVILQKLFDVNKDSTMTFGDSYNDVDMFKESYYSYAMQDADGEIRNIAKHITPNVESILNDVLRMR